VFYYLPFGSVSLSAGYLFKKKNLYPRWKASDEGRFKSWNFCLFNIWTILYVYICTTTTDCIRV